MPWPEIVGSTGNGSSLRDRMYAETLSLEGSNNPLRSKKRLIKKAHAEIIASFSLFG
jgi:hypothetical protein